MHNRWRSVAADKCSGTSARKPAVEKKKSTAGTAPPSSWRREKLSVLIDLGRKSKIFSFVYFLFSFFDSF